MSLDLSPYSLMSSVTFAAVLVYTGRFYSQEYSIESIREYERELTWPFF